MSTKKAGSSSQDNAGEGRGSLYFFVALLEAVGLVSIILSCVLTNHYLGGYAWDGSGKMFNWHPVFMTVGLVFLYGNGKSDVSTYHEVTCLILSCKLTGSTHIYNAKEICQSILLPRKLLDWTYVKTLIIT